MGSQIDNPNDDITLENGENELAKVQAQLSASSNEAKLLNEVNKVVLSADFEYFSELAKKDKTMAERVIEKLALAKGTSTEEIIKLLIKDDNSKNLNQYDIELTVKETIAKQEWEKALAEFIEKAWINKDKDLNEEFLLNFNEYMEWKKFDTNNVKKFAKSAYRDLNEDKVKAFEKKKWEIDAQIGNQGWNSKDKTKIEWRQVLRSTGLNNW